jgi:cytochrome P450
MADTQTHNPSPAIDLMSPSFQQDPFAHLARLREAGPVVRVTFPILGKMWLTTTYEATEAAAKDSALFVLEGKNAGKSGTAGLGWWAPKSLRLLANTMLQKDEPDHRRLRKLVDQAFARRGILEMRPDVEAVADSILDTFEGADRIDLLHDYSRRLPIIVICDLLGLPKEDHDVFAAWGKNLNISNPLHILRLLGSLRKMTAYLRGQIEEVRAAPRPGLISELVRAEADGDKLSADELVAMVFLLLVAGFETTTNLIAGSIVALERNPEQKAFLLADPPARMERAVEELARYVSAVQGTKPRFVSRDCTFFGQTLKRGELMMAFPAAANCDPAVFDEPEALKLDRFPNPHLVFSSGIHFCLGQQLARVETQAALTRLYARFPRLQIVDIDALTYQKRPGTRALTALPVTPN